MPPDLLVRAPLGPAVGLGDELGVKVDDVVDGVGVGLVEEADERGVAARVSQLAEPVRGRGPDAVGEGLPFARAEPREIDAERARLVDHAELLGLGHERPGGGVPRRVLERLER